MNGSMTVDQALAEAATQWGQGNTHRANELAQLALRAEPDHPGALNMAACAAFDAGNWGVALALFQKAVQAAPQDHSMQGNLARNELVLGRIESARRRADYLASVTPEALALQQEVISTLHKSQRPSALAGSFYAADADQLAREVGLHVGPLGAPVPESTATTQQPNHAGQAPKVLVVPHAGHMYSGRTAGKAYALLAPLRDVIRRVVVLGPAHRVGFEGIALPGVGSFATPLGPVLIDSLGADAIADMPQVVTRPDAHALEHSLEVHLPFLQRVLQPAGWGGPGFSFLPLLVGDASPQQVREVIERLWGGPETLIIISTDLSHFHTYGEANAIDAATCAQVLAQDACLTHEQACGATPLNAALQIARKRGLRIEQLERCNSGDTAGSTPEGRSRVVGYASFALREPGSLPATKSVADRADPAGVGGQLALEFSAEQGLALLQLARASLHEATGAAKEPSPGTKSFAAPGASFVTLTEGGQLRGCIGSLQAHRPLAEDVRANAAAAALHDTRFAPVTAEEAPLLQVEVSVLSAPDSLRFANESHALWQLQPHVHGVILECEHLGRRYRSTYLPQVWEQIPQPRAFMAHLKLKAGLPFYFWSPAMRLSVYRVQKFQEA